MRIRILAAFFLLALMGISVVGGISAALAAPLGASSNVTIELVTGSTASNGTSGNVDLTLSGTSSGAPFVIPLDQPGDLQPGMVNLYSFSVPYTFCQLFAFSLSLDTNDDWLGMQVSIAVGGAVVWSDTDYSWGGALTATHARGASWDGTDAYRSRCQTVPVQLTFVTGANGTVDTPIFYLQGDFSASPYILTLNQPGDLQPGMTNNYIFNVPMGFCQITNGRLVKGMTNGVDDPWQANEIYVIIDGTLLYSSKNLGEGGPITANSNIAENWSTTPSYQSRCPERNLPSAVMVMPTTSIHLIPGLTVLNTPTPFHFIIAQQVATPTVFLLHPALLLLPTDTPQPSEGGTLNQCGGAELATRLKPGDQGRVLPGAPNRMRSTPAVTNSSVVGLIPAGGVFTVIQGPICHEGYTWWVVSYNGIVGWTAENDGKHYFVEPASWSD